MELQIFLILFGAASIFILAGALSKDRINLIPGALIFLLLGSFLATGTGLEIQTGINYEYEQINDNYEVTEKEFIFTEYEPPVAQDRFSEALGISFIMIGLYYFLISMGNVNFRSTMRGND